MTSLQSAISWISDGLLLALLVGLFARGRYRTCYFFTLYAVAALVMSTMVRLDPDRFFTWAFWLVRDTILAAIKLAMALELATRTFQSFPGALARARRVMLLVLVVFLVVILLVPSGGQDSASFYPKLLPRVQNGTAWLLTTILGVVLWYRLPLLLFRKAILVGFVPMLLVSTLAVQIIDTWGAKSLVWGAELRVYAGYIEGLAYVLAAGYWAHSAWRPVIPTVPDATGKGSLEGWLRATEGVPQTPPGDVPHLGDDSHPRF